MAFVAIAAIVLHVTAQTMTFATDWLEIGSYSLIAVVGAWLLWSKIKGGHHHHHHHFVPGGGHDHGDHDHDHDHDACARRARACRRSRRPCPCRQPTRPKRTPTLMRLRLMRTRTPRLMPITTITATRIGHGAAGCALRLYVADAERS